MPSTYTSLLRLTLPADGELIGTWGQVVNNGITTLEETAIAGTTTIAMPDANRTLTTANGATDEARGMVIALSGALTAQRDLVVPATSKIYFVRNFTTGGFGVNVKSSSGTATVVPNGTSMLLWVSGATGSVAPAISTLTGTGQFFLADGSAASPSLSFLSDTNTGMYWGGADAIQFATGGVSRITFDGNGQVILAVPTNSGAPNLSMTVAAGGFGIDMRGRSSDNLSVFRFLNNAGSAQSATFQYDNSNGMVIGPTVASVLQFMTSNTARMNIDTSGNVRVTGPLMAAPNFYVGETTAAAGTVGISGSLGSSIIYWGNAASGAGRMDVYTGGGASALFQKVASAVNYFEFWQSAANVDLQLVMNGASTNVGCNYISKGVGSHAFWGQYGAATAQFVVNPVASATRYLVASGAVSAQPTLADSGAVGMRFANCGISVIGAGRPWGGGAIAESQAYAYNVALGLCNMTATANNRNHEWYKDATALYGLWISDNGGAAGQWIKVTGGQAAGSVSIDMVATTMNLSSGTGGVVITGSATSNGTLVVQDTGAAGANIKLVGDGATTPNKFIRVTGGAFQIINSSYTTSPLALTDAGVMTDVRGLSWARDAGTSGGSNPPVGSIIFGSVGATVIAAFATVNAATTNILVSNTASGTSTAVNAGTWRNLGARDASVGHALWLRTA